MLIARYGGKRPLLRGAYCLLAYRLGAFGAYLDIDWSRVHRLVIACHGNICRSPYAESRACQLGLPATSFGLRASPGARADAAAVRNAAQRGTDLTLHRSRSVDTITLRASDLLVAMEPGQAGRLLRLTRGAGAQLTLQGLWASAPRPYVPDPYGRGDVCFQHSYALIDSSLDCMKLMIRGLDQLQPTHRGEPRDDDRHKRRLETHGTPRA
jgi:protein-tyrosine phosphatase